MGHKFSLTLSRQITDDESAILGAECAGSTFTTDSLPTKADVTVTRIDFDDTVSPSLAKAIESGLEAVKKVADLGVPGLTVPSQAPADKAPADKAPADKADAADGAGAADEAPEPVTASAN